MSYAETLRKNNPTIRELPDYFTRPLFKHPPLFPLLSSWTMRAFHSEISAVYVSAFFGACLIVLSYFMGRFYFGEKLGLVAAFAAWLDPAQLICSQKMWMDTMLAFFMLLALLLFAYGCRYHQGI